MIGMMKKNFRSWAQDLRGGTAVMFAVAIPVIVGSVGMAVDLSQAYLVKTRLTHALDAAALAAVASESSEADINAKLQQFFDANYPPEKIGMTYDIHATLVGDEVTVTASASYYTSFLQVLGVDSIGVSAQTVVQREVKGVEVAMVLDVTGSMSTNNNIGTLRTAATNFVNIMFERADDRFVRIGLVPFATSVNVGPYGLGKNPDGTAYGDGSSFVRNRHGLTYTTSSSSTQWRGCILEGAYPSDVEDHEGPWEMYRYCRRTNDDVAVCELDSRGRPRANPNKICPASPVVPLTNDQNKLLTAISGLQADGNTQGNTGMTWGYRLISPEYPFTEGSAWDSEFWSKAVIMMTDGANTINTTYSGYGLNSTLRTSDLNNRFAETCELLKEQDVIIYTIIFTTGLPESSKTLFRECATDESKYFYAPSQTDLIDTFETIGRELSNLHIKG